MSAILFAPHGDDETLFAFYTLLKWQPLVVIVLYSDPTRVLETERAMHVAKCAWEQWLHPESRPDWVRIRREMGDLITEMEPDVLIAPAYEQGGHEHHNAVARIVAEHVGRRIISYLTYRRGEGRSCNGIEVMPGSLDVVLKAEALNCYKSQQQREDTAYWFRSDDQREFVL